MKCPECGEQFELLKPDGDDGMAPWYLDVVHYHGEGEPHWVGIVYQHAKGQRYPKDLKRMVEERKEQKKRILADRKAAPAVPTCPLHPEGCRHD